MVKVLIVDDSAVIRKMLASILSIDAEIEVVGAAQDAFAARDKIKLLRPDVLTLDIEMPKMDGLTFLKNLMALHPIPVVMVSALTQKGAETTLKALELGAVDFISKPESTDRSLVANYAEEITGKVKAAAKAKLRSVACRNMPDEISPVKPIAISKLLIDIKKSKFKSVDKIIAIGASTGGTEAIREVLSRLPVNSPGIVISQHIPETFSRTFAQRLDQDSALTVSEAIQGEPIRSGHAYVAPGNRHLQVRRDGAGYICHLSDAAPVNRHRPSVEVMYQSVAESAGANAVCVLLTGMGDDGSDAMGVMRAAGAPTIAQDKGSSVVWGMPGEAVRRGHADVVLPLQDIAEKILYYAGKKICQELKLSPAKTAG